MFGVKRTKYSFFTQKSIISSKNLYLVPYMPYLQANILRISSKIYSIDLAFKAATQWRRSLQIFQI